jgi:hypothetical protein
MMSDDPCMRWGPGGRQSWRRRSDGGFDSSRYQVREIRLREAKPFVLENHYLATMPSARRCYGLFEAPRARLVGVAVLSYPTSEKTIPSVFPELDPIEAADLGRFVLLDEVPANGDYFLGHVRRLAALPSGLTEPGKDKDDAREENKKIPLRGLVMFSDPVARRRGDGTLITPGHVGTIYQASGFKGLEPSGRSVEAVLPDGTVFGRRTMQKIRAQEQGHRYAEERLIAWGARPMRPGEKPAAWLREALDAAGARKFTHPGKFRYAVALGESKADRRAVLIAGARDHRSYPKKHRAQLELFSDCGDGQGA